MKKESAKQLVTETFDSSFEKEKFTYFIKNLFKSIDPATFTYRGNTIRKSYQEYIKTLTRVGKYPDPKGNKLDILIVQLQKETSLERARTMQRNFVAWYLSSSRSYAKDAAVVAFVAPNQEDWRFSLVKMEYDLDQTSEGNVKIKKELTPARRWSFLVGEHENTHTARKQLLPLLTSEEKPSLTDLEDAFDIEVVTKEFFEKYRKLYHKVKDALDKVSKENEAVKKDFEDKNVDTVDFAKKLLGQIVFLYFLQKKGWFGVSRDADWGTGPKDFLRRLFEGKLADYDNFFNDILEPLFYEALAVERPDDYYSRFNCKIPFLNGGLFDPIFDYDWVHTDINLSNELFSNKEETKEGDIGTGILDIFDRYNFTVKEDEPLEKEVAIDPEMLGKVFENLLEVEDRKSKGTYYTPREIVHYMCQESLINYLATELAEELGSVKEDELKEAVRVLVEHGESLIEHEKQVEKQNEETETYTSKMPKLVKENADFIDEKLAEIKVCDPAVGSGAFPVGMMKEIVSARRALTPFIDDGDRTTYEFKRHAIQNSLYGVDIDPGAVEIAKLRLWLSLIVDEESRHNIRALPNLDYKIMQGNSLLSEYEGVKLDIDGEDEPEQGKFEVVKTETEKLTDRLQELRNKFFKAKHKSEKDKLKKQIEDLTWDLIETALKEKGKENKLEEIKEFKKSNTRPFFLWHINFSEVFEDRGGFDIVIGNPPYLRIQGIKKSTPELTDIYKNKYETATGSYDLYVLFTEKGFMLLNRQGVLNYIMPHKWINSRFGRGLREFTLREGSVKKLISFGSNQVFNVSNYTSLIWISPKPFEEIKYKEIKEALPKAENIGKALNNLKENQFSVIDNKWLKKEAWILTGKDAIKVIKKINIQPLSVGAVFARVSQGIASGKESVFFLEDCTVKNQETTGFSAELQSRVTIERALLKPILKGKDVDKYKPLEASHYTIFPYHFEKGKTRGVTEKFLKTRFPLGYSYLKKNETVLRARENRRFDNNKEWFLYSRKQGITDIERPKIITPEISLGTSMSFDSKGKYYHNTKCYSLVKKNNIQHSYLGLLGILNSKLLWFFIKTTGYVLRGGYYTFSSKYLEPFPLPQLDRQTAKKIEPLVDKIIKKKKQNSNSNTKDLETQIDQLVYKLYNLTPEEIGIVEGSTN
ncbi:MAG: TaqI-like C-terminal specificity domain-containing protein [Patescibacteria group bacterium]|nr:TaqI-like C-terminal specificity domain-containing protein [Patescibacteria group bacterium]